MSTIRCGDLLVDHRDGKSVTVIAVVGESVLVDGCIRGFGEGLCVDQIRAVPWLSVQHLEGQTPYLQCPDYPNVCSHPEGECSADVEGQVSRIASFKRIG